MEGLFRRRRLPHWDVADGTYFVTACLHGSIPAQGLLDLYRYRDELSTRPKPSEIEEEEWELRRHKMIFARLDDWIDDRPAVRWLENPDAAQVVRDSILHFAGVRYDLLAYVVMPSHFHWVFHPRPEWCETIYKTANGRSPREIIMQGVKGFTAWQCNRILKRSGPFWQDEAWDHVVRSADELERIVVYVENNPVKARLVQLPELWKWSSAHDRKARTVVAGEYAIQ